MTSAKVATSTRTRPLSSPDQLAVLVPVLQRPHRVTPLLDSIAKTTRGAQVLFICDPDDVDEQRAIDRALPEYEGRLEVAQLERAGGYAYKINEAAQETDRPLLFIGADDLVFHRGWLDAAARRLSLPVQVVGVNDLIRRRRQHATHFLMTAEYAQQPCLDGSRGPIAEAYDHSFTDDELIATAMARGAYLYAKDAYVEHLHPFGGRGTDDDVYRKGRARFAHDRRTFNRRQALWT